MSNNFSKFFGAALLTLAVVGGATAYMANSLKAVPVKYALDGVTTEQALPQHPDRHAEVIVTEGWAS